MATVTREEMDRELGLITEPQPPKKLKGMTWEEAFGQPDPRKPQPIYAPPPVPQGNVPVAPPQAAPEAPVEQPKLKGMTWEEAFGEPDPRKPQPIYAPENMPQAEAPVQGVLPGAPAGPVSQQPTPYTSYDWSNPFAGITQMNTIEDVKGEVLGGTLDSMLGQKVVADLFGKVLPFDLPSYSDEEIKAAEDQYRAYEATRAQRQEGEKGIITGAIEGVVEGVAPRLGVAAWRGGVPGAIMGTGAGALMGTPAPVGGQVGGALAGAGLGFTTGTTANFYFQGAGEFLRSMREAGVSDEYAVPLAAGYAVPYAALEYMQMGMIAAPFKRLATKQGMSELAKLAKANPEVGKIAWDTAKKVLGTGFAESIQEGLQKGTQEAAIGTGQYAMGNIEGAKQTFTNLPHEVAAETVNVLPTMMLFGGPGNVATGVRQAVSNEAIEGRAIRRLAEAVEKEQALPKQQPPPPQAPPGPEQGPQAGPIPPGAQPGTWTPPQGEETPVGTTLSTGILPRPEDLTGPQPTTEQAQGPVEPEWAPVMRKRGWAVTPVQVEQPGAEPVQGWDVDINGKHLLFTPPMDPEGVGSPHNFLHSVAQDHIQSEDPAKKAAAEQAAAIWNNPQATPEQVEAARQQAVAAGIRGTGGTITFQQDGQTDILGIIGLYDLERETGTKFHETAHLTRTFFLNTRENKQIEKEKAFRDEQGQFDEEKFANAARAESLRQKYRGMALEEYGTGIEKTIHKFNQRVGDFIGSVTGKRFEQIVREMNSGKLMARGVQTTPEQQKAQGARAPEQAPVVTPVEQARPLTGQPPQPPQAAPAQQTPVPEPVTQEVTPKQPWEMTRENFFNSVPDPSVNWMLTEEDKQSMHRSVITDALRENKRVPPEVLAEYPDLQPTVKESLTVEPQPAAPSSAISDTAARAGEQMRQIDRQQPTGTVTSEDVLAGKTPGTSALKHGEVTELPIDRIKLSEDVPQFKEEADESGIVESLQGKYSRTPLRPIVVWERQNGDLEVITGRHRLDLARRSGENTIPAQVLKESEGFTKQQAIILDAEANIQDGQGSVYDHAQYIRQAGLTREEAQARGLVRGDKAEQGFTIGKYAGDDLYTIYINERGDGTWTDKKVATIARIGQDNDGLQHLGINYVLKNPRASAEQVGTVMQAFQNMSASGTQTDMFGESVFDGYLAEAEKRSKKALGIQRDISERLKILKAAKINPEKARNLGIDINVKDPNAIKSMREQMEQELYRWKDWPQYPDLVQQVVGKEDVESAGEQGAETPTDDQTTTFFSTTNYNLIDERRFLLQRNQGDPRKAWSSLESMVLIAASNGDPVNRGAIEAMRRALRLPRHYSQNLFGNLDRAERQYQSASTQEEQGTLFSTLSPEMEAERDLLLKRAGGDTTRAWKIYERMLSAAATRGEPVDPRLADTMRRALLGTGEQADLFGEAAPQKERRTFTRPAERPVQQSLEGLDDGMLFSTAKDVTNTAPMIRDFLKTKATNATLEEWAEAHDKWNDALTKWVDTSPDMIQFVNDNKTGVSIVSKDSYPGREGKWRVSWFSKREGNNEWLPTGHVQFESKIEAVKEAQATGRHDSGMLFSTLKDAEALVVPATEAGYRGPIAQRSFAVPGYPMSDTKEEAARAYLDHVQQKEEFEQEKQTWNEVAPKLLNGTYTDDDVKRVTRFGKTSASRSETMGILEQLGLRPVDANKVLKATPAYDTTREGSVLYDIGQAVETARNKGYFVQQGKQPEGTLFSTADPDYTKTTFKQDERGRWEATLYFIDGRPWGIVTGATKGEASQAAFKASSELSSEEANRAAFRWATSKPGRKDMRYLYNYPTDTRTFPKPTYRPQDVGKNFRIEKRPAMSPSRPWIVAEQMPRGEWITDKTSNTEDYLGAAERRGMFRTAREAEQWIKDHEGTIGYSTITDTDLINELESGEIIQAYRAMQLIDGKLYPPMSAKVQGELRQPTELGVWEQSEEQPELAKDGFFTLNKGNKKSIKARYNPYFHVSTSPLNDQFSEAHKRPNLVTVEVAIPASELKSGYKAEGAKDAVGKVQWRSGPVSTKTGRDVFLSRYAKAIRIVPDSEVAELIAKSLQGKNVSIPAKVVTPSLKQELEKQGVPIRYSTAESHPRPLGLPELDRLMVGMLDKHPEIRRRMPKRFGGEMRGFFQPGKLDNTIALKADLFIGPDIHHAYSGKKPTGEQINQHKANMAQEHGVSEDELVIQTRREGNGYVTVTYIRDHGYVGKTLAHEIGHADDYLPDKMMERGNLLGRIAKLAHYLKGTLDPTGNVSLTQQIKKRLKTEAGIEASKKYDIEKERIEYFKERYAIYRKLLSAEIENRNLYSAGDVLDTPGIRTELIALTKWWSSDFDEKGKGDYDKYRRSGKELYADAISVLLNNPDTLQQKAPQFYDALMNFFDKHQPMADLYRGIQEELHAGKSPKEWLDRHIAMNARDSEVRDKAIKRAMGDRIPRTPEEIMNSILYNLADVTVYLPNQEARQAVKDINYAPARLTQYQRDVKEQIADVLTKAGVKWEEFGAFLGLRRAANERKDMANPGLVRGEDAQATLDALRKRLGDEGYGAIEQAAKAAWDIRKRHVIPLLKESRLFSEELMEHIENNDEYATFSVAKYFSAYHGGTDYSAAIRRQIGTAEATMNPFFATVRKDAALLMAALTNIAKRTMVEQMGQFDKANIKPAKTRWDANTKTHVPVEPENTERWGLVQYSEDGKRQGVYVRREIADLFKHDPAQADIIFKALSSMTGVLKSIFTTNNPFFSMWNVQRDFRTTLHQIPTKGGLSEVTLLPELSVSYAKTLRDAYQHAFKKHSTPLMRELLEKGLVIADRQWSARDVTGVDEYDRMVAEWSLSPDKLENVFKKGARAIFHDFNQMVEVWGKLAGYEYMQRKGLVGEHDMRQIMRGIVSTPDALARGTYTKWTNAIFLYSNMQVQGLEASARAFKANPTRYILRRMAYTVLPSLMMAWLAFGGDDDDDKELKDYRDAFNAIPDWEKTRRHAFPVAWDGSKVTWIPLPQDYMGELIHGIIWNLFGSKDKTIGKLANVIMGAIPMEPGSLNPWLDLGRAALQYALGQNPYDFFRGRPAIDEQVFRAGGFRSAQEFAKWAWNQTGGSTFGSIERPFEVRPRDTRDLPIIKPAMRRFVRTAEKQEAPEPVDRERARTVVSAKDFISDYIREADSPKAINPRKAYTQWKRTTTVPKGYDFTDFKRLYDNLYEKRWPKKKAS